jgi:predicted RNA-binding Zn-ribbon protein involved in translation (DUF1610 family)
MVEMTDTETKDMVVHRVIYLCPDCEGELKRDYSWCPWCGEEINWARAAFREERI